MGSSSIASVRGISRLRDVDDVRRGCRRRHRRDQSQNGTRLRSRLMGHGNARSGETVSDIDAGTPVPRPLDGVIVVDASTYMAGPFATLMLSDLGAKVIKV